ncbi:MAG: MBL fold metallo-hydrolase [Puniceicoccales bacterium]|jgi:glyoxylase-like metal-dependent hydrolase (beta-lactamase superfamily II)|nr:MBL fold metallo-hydrolase [Puniceicoccales bacterium]
MSNKKTVWHRGNEYLYAFQFGRLYTNTGVFINSEKKTAFMVDAPFGSYEFLKESLLRGVAVEALLITHGHWDHIGDAHLFKKDGAKVYAHGGDRMVIEDPSLCISYLGSDMGVAPCALDCVIGDDGRFQIAGMEVHIRSVPGHSPGSVIFYMERAGIAFVGDTLFRDGIGRSDLPEGNGKLLIAGIGEKILSLPDDTTIIPGHGPFTTVAHESRNNAYLR